MSAALHQRTTFEAILLVDQVDRDDVIIGQVVHLQLDEIPSRVFAGEIGAISDRHLEVAPIELSNKTQGPLATFQDLQGREVLVSPTYQASVSLDVEQGMLRSAMRGKARIRIADRSVGNVDLAMVSIDVSLQTLNGGKFSVSMRQWLPGIRSRHQKIVRRIFSLRQSMENLSDDEITQLAQKAAWDAQSGRSSRAMLPHVFALAIEATRRVTGKVHYPVQVLGALAMYDGHIAEMQTGEGKTLTAILPVVLRAVAGRGVHVVTANEYLARRDAEEMSAIYKALNLTCSCVYSGLSDDERRAAYDCDITYGTASEMGFRFFARPAASRRRKRRPSLQTDFPVVAGRQSAGPARTFFSR